MNYQEYMRTIAPPIQKHDEETVLGLNKVEWEILAGQFDIKLEPTIDNALQLRLEWLRGEREIDYRLRDAAYAE